jgi:hypothetical protein
VKFRWSENTANDRKASKETASISIVLNYSSMFDY